MSKIEDISIFRYKIKPDTKHVYIYIYFFIETNSLINAQNPLLEFCVTYTIYFFIYFLQSYLEKDSLMSVQYPLPDNTEDFLRLIKDFDARVVVFLCPLEDIDSVFRKNLPYYHLHYDSIKTQISYHPLLNAVYQFA